MIFLPNSLPQVSAPLDTDTKGKLLSSCLFKCRLFSFDNNQQIGIPKRTVNNLMGELYHYQQPIKKAEQGNLNQTTLLGNKSATSKGQVGVDRVAEVSFW